MYFSINTNLNSYCIFGRLNLEMFLIKILPDPIRINKVRGVKLRSNAVINFTRVIYLFIYLIL